MKNILFVDDDPNVLSGLRRMLRPMKKEWQMQFVESGELALDRLADSSFDVIVSDMRMPGMNGADLLRSVMQDYPNTIRIAFSGQAEREMTLDVTTSAHQYLSKPCDAEQVKYTIDRACNLRQILANDDLQQLVAGLSTLPSLPELYLQIVEKIKSEDTSVRDIGDTIGHDIAMTAKILQLVNSAFFNLQRHVSTPADAVTLLGIDVVKALVLSTKLFSGLEQGAASVLNVSEMWRFSSETGALAREIAKLEKTEAKTRDYALMAGMLHSVGSLVLAVNRTPEYAKVKAAAESDEREIWELEKTVFGHSHMDVGAYMLGLWGLADPIVEAMAYYRRPQLLAKKEFTPLTAVHGANALLMGEQETNNKTRFLDLEYLTDIGVADRVEQWGERLQQMREEGE